MKCPGCGGAGVIQGQAPGLVSCCPACDGKGFIEQTNEEWRKTCSAEEFADWLMETFDLCGAGCSNCFVKEMCFVDNEMLPTEMIVMWLKQPHHLKE